MEHSTLEGVASRRAQRADRQPIAESAAAERRWQSAAGQRGGGGVEISRRVVERLRVEAGERTQLGHAGDHRVAVAACEEEEERTGAPLEDASSEGERRAQGEVEADEAGAAPPRRVAVAAGGAAGGSGAPRKARPRPGRRGNAATPRGPRRRRPSPGRQRRRRGGGRWRRRVVGTRHVGTGGGGSRSHSPRLLHADARVLERGGTRGGSHTIEPPSLHRIVPAVCLQRTAPQGPAYHSPRSQLPNAAASISRAAPRHAVREPSPLTRRLVLDAR